ncbi:UDP-N-acetylmuramoyl-L-alanyl-D-glutamate--2,6-diaminopimelate ligase [Alphaproteobacteria bacterium]|nr:UDP-N-acetylmuramoyl-L-alanyl-D-glutamate--2,6-diaminopimelate ligase [Alphaproteobacteria bacterium]
MKLLSDLMETSCKPIEILGLASDSREVLPGYLFAAFDGNDTSGSKFIPDAINRGAVAVLSDKSIVRNQYNAHIITDDNPRLKFAKIVSRFYDKQPEWICAVTGTNGKTSVSSFTIQIWKKLNKKSSSIGTLSFGESKNISNLKSSLTTPDALTLHKILEEKYESGVTHAIIEASSHGLHQFRLDGINCKSAAFTNLSHDHLDYHNSIEEYFLAKERLFSEVVMDNGSVILNRDSEEFDRLFNLAKKRKLSVITYGIHKNSDLCLISTEPHNCGQKIKVKIFDNEYSILFPIYGNYQSLNALCALGLVISSGGNISDATDALGHLEGVPGRLDLAIQLPNRAKIFVDYAHTPAALKYALLALREHTKGRIIIVFGCGGDRDVSKRLAMGKIANQYADRVYITDDNPRSENPQKIRELILKGCPSGIEIDDRRKAIQAAIKNLDPGDVMIVAGKGHETGQLIGKKYRPFNDIVEVKRAASMLGESLV